MRTSLVVTVIGDDRPGIVEELSEHVLAAGGNWEESRMARLAGKFAGLLLASVDEDRAEALAARLTALRSGGLSVVAARGSAADADALQTYSLQVFGSDHPGIVRDIARVLARHGVNIEELETEVTSAPMSGEALFRAQAQLRLPASITAERLRGLLEELAADVMVDVTLSADDALHRS